MKVTYTEDYSDILKIELSLQKLDIAIVEPIQIGESQKQKIDFWDVKNYISENYGISNDKILIN